MLGGQEPEAVHPAYCRYGGAPGDVPVLLTVPHAGREYPADLIASARVGENGLRKLEDRFADRLVAGAVATGHSVLVARRARAFIDLNRHPAELDAYSASGLPRGMALRSSPKLRGGPEAL